MPQQSFMEALFGKKRRVVKRRKTVSKAPKRKVVRKKLPKALKTMAKKHGVRVTMKRGDKRVEKSEKVLKAQIKMAMKREMAKKKASERRVKRKTVHKAPKRKRRVKRTVAKFGKGAGFPPLSQVMSPYPYSVSASPPWI